MIELTKSIALAKYRTLTEPIEPKITNRANCSDKTIEIIELIKQNKIKEPVELAEPAKLIEPIALIQPIQPIEPTELKEPTKLIENQLN